MRLRQRAIASPLSSLCMTDVNALTSSAVDASAAVSVSSSSERRASASALAESASSLAERSSSATASDEEVLRRVWARADDSRNADRRGPMRQSAYDAPG